MKTVYFNNQKIEYNSIKELNVKLGNGVKLGDGVELGNYVKLDVDDCIIEKIINIQNGYKYQSCAFISDKGEKYIELGCCTRKIEDWENDFWNNPSEFPNDGRKKSVDRWNTYLTLKYWLELNK
jgi:NDP-sugar pyrophosphorylase family protein